MVIYIDNNAVRDFLIACYTKNDISRRILVATLIMEMKLQLFPWYARVPTDSNMADAPSRSAKGSPKQVGSKVPVTRIYFGKMSAAFTKTGGETRQQQIPPDKKTSASVCVERLRKQ